MGNKSNYYKPFLMVLFLFSIIFAQNLSEVKVTRWIDPNNSTPLSFEQYITNHPYKPITFIRKEITRNKESQRKILIFINTTLASNAELTPFLQQFYDDLIITDWNPVQYDISGGSPESIKNILINEWDETLEGAIFIGQLPVPWFEMEEEFKSDGKPDKNWVDFPCDLFYMDLDGNWTDSDNNGKYDSHTENWQPDIFIGNLFAFNLFDNEIDLLKSYFERNHKYRWGEIEKTGTGLTYCDDDWISWASEWSNDASVAFGEFTTVSEINTTSASNYVTYLPEKFDLIQTFVHSWPQGHSFKISDGQYYDYLYSTELPEWYPGALFYNLFACSNSRYVEENYMGGNYLFSSPDGLGVIGSTKTGSMLSFGDFYTPLANGHTFGEAFRQWFAIHGQESGNVGWSMSWFYGMTYLGDPTLKINMEIMYQDGDPNNDHNINVLDIVLIIKIILNEYSPTELEFGAADFDNTGDVNISDIVSLISYIMNQN